LTLTVCCTCLESTILPSGWRQWNRQFRQQFASVPMQVKRTWRARKIFILDTSIMTVLWLNWSWHAEVYRTVSKYSRCRVTYKGVRDVGENPHETWSTRLILTRGIFTCCIRLPS